MRCPRAAISMKVLDDEAEGKDRGCGLWRNVWGLDHISGLDMVLV